MEGVDGYIRGCWRVLGWVLEGVGECISVWISSCTWSGSMWISVAMSP